MENISVTITGLLLILLSQFAPVEEVEVVLEAIGIIIAWYGRVRIGDIKVWGVRK